MVEDTNLNEELAQIDEKVLELEKAVQFGQAIAELHEDPNFKLVIEDGYLGEEAERLFEILTIPMNFKRDMLENTMDRLGSIRNMKEYFGAKLIEAASAPEEIEAEKEYRKEVTAKYSATDIEDVEVIEG